MARKNGVERESKDELIRRKGGKLRRGLAFLSLSAWVRAKLSHNFPKKEGLEEGGREGGDKLTTRAAAMSLGLATGHACVERTGGRAADNGEASYWSTLSSSFS